MCVYVLDITVANKKCFLNTDISIGIRFKLFFFMEKLRLLTISHNSLILLIVVYIMFNDILV